MLSLASTIVDYCSYHLFNTSPVTLLQEARCIHNTEHGVASLYTTVFHRRKPIALLDFLAEFMYPFDNCDMCEGERVWLLQYLLIDGAMKVYNAYTGYRMRTISHAYS